MKDKIQVGVICRRAPDGSFTGETAPIYREASSPVGEDGMTDSERDLCDRAAREVFLPLFRKYQEAQKSES